ncbi:unnamed protein product [Leuciscus chuanchicus]
MHPAPKGLPFNLTVVRSRPTWCSCFRTSPSARRMEWDFGLGNTGAEKTEIWELLPKWQEMSPDSSC